MMDSLTASFHYPLSAAVGAGRRILENSACHVSRGHVLPNQFPVPFALQSHAGPVGVQLFFDQ